MTTLIRLALFVFSAAAGALAFTLYPLSPGFALVLLMVAALFVLLMGQVEDSAIEDEKHAAVLKEKTAHLKDMADMWGLVARLQKTPMTSADVKAAGEGIAAGEIVAVGADGKVYRATSGQWPDDMPAAG
jgi:Na+-transporting methylmalonyl-CoA/oxaloacetate decarboxylase gamma subunit